MLDIWNLGQGADAVAGSRELLFRRLDAESATADRCKMRDGCRCDRCLLATAVATDGR